MWKEEAVSETIVREMTPEQRQMARQHIFVVNGAPAFLDLVRALFQDENYNVTTTNFVPRTFDQIQALAPDLLLVDLVLGEQAGWDLLDRLQSEATTRGVPVIVLSTDPSLLERARALDTPDVQRRFLDKPFDIDALLELVRELIGPA
jgi:DNA-binding response OmpR family regulator